MIGYAGNAVLAFADCASDSSAHVFSSDDFRFVRMALGNQRLAIRIGFNAVNGRCSVWNGECFAVEHGK